MKRTLWSTSLIILTLSSVNASQQPFSTPNFDAHSDDKHIFSHPINRIAIIGAGVGGLITYRQLTSTPANFTVHLYERDTHPGGVWHYTEEEPLDAPVPNLPPSQADYEPHLPPEGVELPYEMVLNGENFVDSVREWKAHRLPKPVWFSLESNAPAPDQQIRDFRWPPSTPWALPQQLLQRYLRSFASFLGANSNDNNPNIHYNTRVELVEKRVVDGEERGWTLTLRQFIPGDGIAEDSDVHNRKHGKCKVRWWKEDFDAVVVATGRYNSPSIPNIPGLAEWVQTFPDTISHSRQYRRPEKFQDQEVVVVGAAASGAEIGLELSPFVKKLHVSTRPDNVTAPHYPLSFYTPRLPANTSMIGEIARFHSVNKSIELANGTHLTGIDHILFSTGFRYTFPFLPQYLNSKGLITDGSHVRNLYLDTWFIEEPTLGFVGINAGTQTFTYTDYLATAISHVWSGYIDLPSKATMRKRYEEEVKEKGGYTRHFQFLGSQTAWERIRAFVAWINSAVEKEEGKRARQIDTPDPFVNQALTIWAIARFGSGDFNSVNPSSASVNFDTARTRDVVWERPDYW